MTDAFQELSQLDRLIHAPPRLSILTALLGCHRADFTFLMNLTGLTRGNLSVHLQKLHNAGLIRIEKGYKGRRPNTQVSLTSEGRERVQRHWRRLEELRQSADQWQGDSEPLPSNS